MTWNYKAVEPSRSVDEICISCGNPIEKVRWRNAIEPRKGFIAESKTKEVPLRKPERSYKREGYYIGDPTCKVMYKKTFRIFDDEKVVGTNISSEALFIWKDKKILVFDNDNEKIDICGWTSLYVSEIKPMKFAEIL